MPSVDPRPLRAVAAAPRATAAAVVERFDEGQLLLRASGIAFRVLTAVVPFALFVTGLLGFFGLEETWEREVEPELSRQVSIAAFSVIDSAVTEILVERHTFWATGGLVLAIVQLSAAVRAGGAALDAVYDVRADRPWRENVLRSLWIAVLVALCVMGALAAAALAPLVYGDVGTVAGALLWALRYLIAAVLLLLAVGIVVRHAPSERQPIAWASVGAVLVTVCWLVVTAGFGAYLTAVASYGSIYGAFVTVVVLLAWVYASSLAFVTGVATDAVLRDANHE